LCFGKTSPNYPKPNTFTLPHQRTFCLTAKHDEEMGFTDILGGSGTGWWCCSRDATIVGQIEAV